MGAIIAGIEPGDEVVLPSFTFASTANAFVLRGGVPVFVDIRSDTLNLDETLLEEAVGERTRAVVPVHYGGVGCEMEEIGRIASEHGLFVIEDAAQAFGSSWNGRPLGTFGTLGIVSFQEGKNLNCGEGGALIVNDPGLVERAEIIQQKGTNRSAFLRGEVDKYSWIELGSSFALSDLAAAFLSAQIERAEEITATRIEIWNRYHARFAELEQLGRVRRPEMPDSAAHNAHLYYLLLADRQDRDALIEALAREGITAVFHYVPLHSSPAGQRFGRNATPMDVTDQISDRLVRLPLWVGMSDRDVDQVTDAVTRLLTK